MTFPVLLAVIFASMTCIVIGDTAGKLLMQAGWPPIFVAWARFALGAAMVFPFVGLTSRDLSTLVAPRVLLRGGFISGGIVCILTALRSVPLANAFGAFFIGPIVAYVLAVLFLGERVTRLRTNLLILGFCGVLLVVQPGLSMQPGILFALLAGTFYGAYLAVTRWVAGEYRPRVLLFAQLLFGAIALAPFAWTQSLQGLNAGQLALFGLSAAASAGGNFLLVLASRRVDGSLIAPLIYTQLVAATRLG